MHPAASYRFKRPQRARRTARQTSFATLAAGFSAAAALVAICSLGLLGWFPIFGIGSQTSQPAGGPADLNAEARSGFIFFTSLNQDTCREHTFNNTSGAQHDNGIVDCRIAIFNAKKSQSADRLNAIGDGFRSK
jgi:hypothetical protein